MKSLNADSLKIVSNLYDSKPVFRQGLDRLLHDEVKSAVELSDRLAKLMASDAEPSKTTTVKKAVKKTGTGKPVGRPKGSKNAPKAPKEPVQGEMVEPVEAKRTHGQSIIEVLAGKADGLNAAEILAAISGSNFENYTIPSKATLQTTLVGLREKKALKTKGSRPNTKYIVK